jgi:flagellin-like protein
MKKQKKAVSPVVSTVLLIMIVIVLAIIILLWARGFVKEVITKEIAGNEKSVDMYCMQVELSQIINDDKSFGFENRGNVPLYGFRLKTTKGSSSTTYKVEGSDVQINPGFSILIEDDNGNPLNYDAYDGIVILPILLGKTEIGDSREFECSEESGIELK